MGAIEVQVKTLKGKKPIVFAWENPIKNVVECFLVSCPCQCIGVLETGDMATDPSGAVMCDKNLASAVVLAMEKADLFTHASLDHIDSLIRYINEQKGGKSKSKKRKRPGKNDERQKDKKQKRMTETSVDSESTASVEDVPVDIAGTAVDVADTPSSTEEQEKSLEETTAEIINSPSFETEQQSLPLGKCSEESESTHVQSVVEIPVAVCVDISSDTQELEKPRKENSEDIIISPSFAKEPQSLPLEKCTEVESKNVQIRVEEVQVVACVDVPCYTEEIVKPKETAEQIISYPSLEKKPPSLSSEKCSKELEKAIDETMEGILKNHYVAKEAPSLPLDKCLNDERSTSCKKEEENKYDCSVENVDTSVICNVVVNNGQNAVNSFETTVPVFNNGLLDIITLENVDVVPAAAVTNSVASVVAEGGYERGLLEVINSIIEECPQSSSTHPRDPP